MTSKRKPYKTYSKELKQEAVMMKVVPPCLLPLPAAIANSVLMAIFNAIHSQVINAVSNNPTPKIDAAPPEFHSTLNVVEEYIMNIYRLGLYHMINSIVVILAAAVVVAGCAGTGSKKEEMTLASEQISIARSDVSTAISAGGNEFAPLQVKSAMEKIGRAEQAMTAKEYSRARQLAEQARVDAQLAESTARAAKAQRAADELQKSRRILQEEMVR